MQQRVRVFFPGLQRFALLELTVPARAELLSPSLPFFEVFARARFV